MPGDDDIVTGAQMRELLARQAQSVQPFFQQTQQTLASQAVSMARKEYADEFKRWGPEIESTLAQIPAEARTLDNIATIVDNVRGRHWKELVADEAQRVASGNLPTARANGSAPAGQPSSPFNTSDKIPQQWKDRAASAGLTPAALADFCRVNGMTEQQFYAQFDKGYITAAVADNQFNVRT